MVGQSGVSQISPQQIIAEPPHGLASHPAQSATIGLDSKPYANLQIFEQCGVGPDAVAYRAVRQAERDEVEVRVLSGPIREGDRWAALLKRLRLVQLANSHAITRLLLTQLDAQPPRLIMEKAGETALSRALQSLTGEQGMARLAIAEQIAGAMAAAHTVGLAHGKFSSQAVRIRFDQTVQIDFSGVDAYGSVNESNEVGPAVLSHAPEVQAGCPADLPADVFCLATVLISVVANTAESACDAKAFDAAMTRMTGSSRPSEAAAHAVSKVVREALDPEPARRPSASEVARQLTALLSSLQRFGAALRDSVVDPHNSVLTTRLSQTSAMAIADPPDLDDTSCLDVNAAAAAAAANPTAAGRRESLGRYRLLQKIGQGGMGAVFRAEDRADGTIVALKMLSGGLASDRQALHRFQKEARLLAEARHPNIANLLEINEDQGVHYLVMEYVAGTDLKHVLQKRSPLDERLAFEIAADVTRALIGAHERTIVHRDVKPANVMLAGYVDGGSAKPQVKLLDFGLARHVDQTESLKMTQTGAFLGTPYYMSPEQCTGNGEITPSTDIYAIGATLFEMLAGRPPFMGDDPMKVATMHCFEEPPSLKKLNPLVSDGAVQIVEKCLAKRPEQRYVDAGHLLTALELFLRGEASDIQLHPLFPQHDPSSLFAVDFEWELEASPELLWPYVSNTERLNCAVGVPSVEYQTVRDAEKGLRKLGNFRMAGLNISWEEHPFEWIEGQRSGVLREFTQGPFQWFLSVIELEPRPKGGTLLKHSVRIEPRGWVGRCVAAIEVSLKGRRNLERVYRRIDATLTGKLGKERLTDPFQEAQPLPAARQRRLEQRLDQLIERGIDADIVTKLGEFLRRAPSQELARIRPLVLARRLGTDQERTIEACLHAANCGLLAVHWDILCPTCRVSADVKDTLNAIESHARCEVCDLDFDVDFGNSLELIFRAHAELRDVDLKTYCIGGPEHLPHVVAQIRIAPGERIDLNLQLGEGSYRLRGPQLPYFVPLEIQAVRGATRGQVIFAADTDASAPTLLRAGRQALTLANEYQKELLIRLERTIPRKDVLTAATASSMALFRELFPGETLRRGQLMNVATVTLVAAELDGPARLCDDLGDAQAFEVLQDFYRIAQELMKRHKGAVVKQVDDRVLAAFDDCEVALRAAIELAETTVGCGSGSALVPRIGVHRGPALATTLNDQLDYFGNSVNRAFRLLNHARPGDVVLSQEVSADLSVNELLQSQRLPTEVVCAASSKSGDEILQRVRPRDEAAGRCCAARSDEAACATAISDENQRGRKRKEPVS
jgi:eukaryotic-like serine/threonine-protein kinase